MKETAFRASWVFSGGAAWSVCAAIALADLPVEDWKPVGPGKASFVGTVSDSTNAMHIVGVGGGYCFETTDGGSSWSRLGTVSGSAFSAFDHRRMYVMYSTTCGRTLDGGATWTYWNFNTPPAVTIQTICSHPTDSNVVYAAGYTSSGGFSFCRSANAGETWVEVTNVFNFVGGVNGMAVSPSNPDWIMVCGRKTPSWNALVVVSTNGGATWNDISATVDAQANNELKKTVFDANDHRRMYVAGKYFYSSANGGVSWQQRTAVPAVTALGVDPHSGKIYAAYATSVAPYLVKLCASSDYGNTWTTRETDVLVTPTYPITPTYIEVLRANPANVWISSQNGVFKSEDAGQTLVRADQRFFFGNVAALDVASSRPSRLFASASAGMFRSDNGGDDWTEVSNNGALSSLRLSIAPDDPDLALWVAVDG